MLPPECAECGVKLEIPTKDVGFLSTLFPRIFPRIRLQKTHRLPLCPLHRDYPGSLYVYGAGTVFMGGSYGITYSLTLTCMRQEYLERYQEATCLGVYLPPWAMNPVADNPFGIKYCLKTWYVNGFLPFWHRMTQVERIRYLDQWKAPNEWREELCSDELQQHWNSHTQLFAKTKKRGSPG